MYHAHFALQEEPFGVSPDRRFFYETEQHREALATLYYAVKQRRGFALLVGRAGLGKTSVLVQLLEMLRGEAETVYLPHPYFDRNTVLESILVSLGLDTCNALARNHRTFYEYLVRTQSAGKTCVIVFDEAQNLNLETLETIRMLSNFETPTEKLVQIVLSGQPGLAETLARPEMEQMRQRLNVVARLNPMRSAEARDYIFHRNRMAGASSGLFEPDAIEAISAASGGIPRNVNTICFNCLTLAYALNLGSVRTEEVTEVLRDLDLGNLHPQPAGQPSGKAPMSDCQGEKGGGLAVALCSNDSPAKGASGLSAKASGRRWWTFGRRRSVYQSFLNES